MERGWGMSRPSRVEGIDQGRGVTSHEATGGEERLFESAAPV